MHILSISLVLAVTCFSSSQAILSVGKCPEIPIIRRFDTTAYQGLWYEISKLPNEFELGLRCIQAEYGPVVGPNGVVAPNQISVLNTGVYRLFGSLTQAQRGSAVPFNITEPNKLRVTFDQQIFGIKFQSEGQYNVLDVDYTHYSLVYSCSETNYFFFTVKDEYAWILSRTRVITPHLKAHLELDVLKSRLGQFTDVSRLVDTDQTGCA